MEMTIYKNADDFLIENKDVMEQHSIQANLIWVNALSKKSVEDGFFGVSIIQGESIYLAIQTTPHPMVHFSVGDDIKDMAELLAKYLSANNLLPEKINGIKKTVDIFYKVANELGADYKESRYLYLYECRNVENIFIVDGKYQSPITAEFDFGPWYIGFYKDCELDDPIDKAAEKARKMVDNGSLVCFVIDGKPVTMAAKTRQIPGGRCISAVYTPNDFRGNGYSIACMKHLTQEILDEGNDTAFLYADKYNPISNHVYEKIGYKKIGDFMEYCRI